MEKNILIEKSKEIYGEKYDYSLVRDKFLSKEKLYIICPIHGVFEKTYEKHINGKQGCPKCSGKFRYDTKSFIEECLKQSNIEGLTFDNIKYKNNKTKVTMYCHHKDEDGIEHGEFEITPGHFLRGERCPKCRYIKSASKKRRSIDEIIELSKEIHGNKYDYSLITDYKNNKEKLPIICPEHGIFYQSMNNHINNKQGCPKCSIGKNSIEKILTNDEFIERCSVKHNDKYDYSKTYYKGSREKVSIICPEHGEFEQIARNHLFGQGCPKCFKEKSNFEKEILEFIKNNLVDDTIIENDRNILNGKEIDIYIPKYKIGFELNGLIWHSEKFNFDKNYHLNKTEECEKQGIRLIHIFEDEWIYKNDITKSRILNVLGITPNIIYARKCNIKEVTNLECKTFLNKNHIQGSCISKYRYGLYYNDELVSLMTFGKLRKVLNSNHKDGYYELLRFCNKLNTTVVGGASKLLKYFINNIKPLNIISYADRRWSNGNLYKKIGFTFVNNTTPNYFYVINKQRHNRFNYRKDILVSKYDCPKDMTEKEFCNLQGWYRIYDCGNKKYELKCKSSHE